MSAIINIGSMNSLGPLPETILDTTSKHGISAISKTVGKGQTFLL